MGSATYSTSTALQASRSAGRRPRPQGTRVHAFKVPSREEPSHDVLWRSHQHAPARGEVVIFNRSHCEDVFVVRVHDLVPRHVWSKRYDLINDFERNLVESGAHVFKFYLHISEDEQLEHFERRLDDPTRRWKISESDYSELARLPAYVAAHEEALARTSTARAPWYVIPANHKWFRDLAVSQILVETLGLLGMELPRPTVDLDEIGRKYHQAASAGTRTDAGSTKASAAESHPATCTKPPNPEEGEPVHADVLT